ncbi:hypothetical protein B7463_g3180, partial [Scytalidium lignicola]
MAKIPDPQQEGRVLLAINAIKKGQITSIRKAARVFDVPRSTLNARLQGTPQHQTIYTKCFRMSQLEEESLVQWILSMGKRGLPPRPSGVQSMANILVAERGEPTPPRPVGKNWFGDFLKRHPELTTKYIRRYNYKRAKCEDPKLIQEWFDNVMAMKAQYGILDEDTYNFDETGFAMGIIAFTKVVTSSDCYGKPPLLEPGNREWVTAIESVNACGWALPPLIVFKGKVSLLGWYDNLPQDWRITINVSCFAVLKRVYGGLVEKKMCLDIQHINKLDFLEMYPIVRQETFKSSNIRQGFAGIELVPYNPDRVMSKLRLEVEEISTPPKSSYGNSEAPWVPETPHNSIQLQKQYEIIQSRLRQYRSPSTPTRIAFAQLLKGCQMTMHSVIFLTKEKDNLKAVNQSIQQKAKRSRKRITHKSSLTAQEAQEMAQSSTIAQEVVEVANPESITQTLPAPQRRPPKCSGQVYVMTEVENVSASIGESPSDMPDQVLVATAPPPDGSDSQKTRKIIRRKKRRPARPQVEYGAFESEPPPQTGVIFNIWYNKWSGGDRESSYANQTHAKGRCNIVRDSGYTQADGIAGSYFCLFFARGLCPKGSDCQYLHRLPSITDIFNPNVDCFGRDKFSGYRDDMGGTGSFMRINRTIYVGRIHVTDDIEEVVARHFAEWGQVERIRVLNTRGVAFITYTNESNAQFAKEAMAHQSLDKNEILNVRWATADPNPMAQKREARRIEEQAAEAIRAALPPEYVAELEGRDSETRKRQKIGGNFGLEGYAAPDDVWYNRTLDGDRSAGQDPAGEWEFTEEPKERLAIEHVNLSDYQMDSNSRILSSSTLAVLKGQNGGLKIATAKKNKPSALVDYESDNETD